MLFGNRCFFSPMLAPTPHHAEVPYHQLWRLIHSKQTVLSTRFKYRHFREWSQLSIYYLWPALLWGIECLPGALSYPYRLPEPPRTTSKTSLNSDIMDGSQDCLFAPISTTTTSILRSLRHQ
jgi:hypothetical protein